MCVPGCEDVVRHALTCRGLFAGAAATAFAATAVMPEPAAAATRRFRNVVDLTHTMSPEFPTFFGVPGIEMQRQFDFKKDGFNLIGGGSWSMPAPISMRQFTSRKRA